MKIIADRDGELLEFLEEKLDVSKKTLKQYLKHGNIYVENVKTTKYDYPIRLNNVIIIKSKNKEVIKPPFPIIYEDENIIVVDKPSGILTMATNDEKEQTVYHIVREYLISKNRNSKIFIIHRLDKDTSGVLIFAKNEYAKKLFQENWNDLVKERSYIAIVHGVLSKKEDTLLDYLSETSTNLVYISNKNKGKVAITKYKVIKESNNFSKLEIHIETGRKNQIRVQLANINHPIVGDKKYGIKDNEKRLFLHANRLQVFNPITRKNMLFKCDIPKAFKYLLK